MKTIVRSDGASPSNDDFRNDGEGAVATQDITIRRRK